MQRFGRCGTRAGGGNGDCCRPAVVRAYREMHAKGQPDRYCFEAAVIVYLWHHPDTPQPEAMDIVGSWVSAGTLH